MAQGCSGGPSKKRKRILLSKRAILLRSQIYFFTRRVVGEQLPLALAVIKHARLWGEIRKTVSAIEREEEKGYNNMNEFYGLNLEQFMRRFRSLPIGRRAIIRHWVLSEKARGKFPRHIIIFLESLGSEQNESDTSIPPPGDEGVI